MSISSPTKRVCVGIVTGAQGIRGAVRIKSFTADPVDIDAYGPVSDEAETRTFGIEVQGVAKGVVVAKLQGITDRNAAEALKGLHLYVDRDRLPPPDEDEFYHADLLGLRAELVDGKLLGRVTAVHDFGAGDSLEVTGEDGHAVMVPFTKAAVPVIDFAEGRLVIDPPVGLFDKPEPPASLAEQEEMPHEPADDAAGDAA